jgi:DNA helicase-2/ATP-dependent DNA helicase PcrA
VARLFAEFGESLFRWRTLAESGQLLNLFDTLVADLGYHLYLNEISDDPDQAAERSENVQELRGLLARAEEEKMTLTDFLTEQSLVADVDALEAGADSITLLTLHAAKGLEFPVVFITGLEEGLLPHIRSFEDPDGMAEERRLLYVGVTRAKDYLFLTYAFRRSLYGGRSEANVASRFLEDLPAERVDGLSPRMRVQQDINHFREQTRWDSPVFGTRSPFRQSGQEDGGGKRETNEKIRSKIVPFPGGRQPGADSETRFVANQRVKHVRFGTGTVIGSKGDGPDEKVTVNFDDKKVAIKTIMADFLSPAE